MVATLLFVHGTGVRGAGYVSTITAIKRAVREHQIPLTVRGTLWGEAEGAQLRGQGLSIPAYDATGGGDVDLADLSAARWSVLYTDPWYELRLLGNHPQDAAPFGADPTQELLDKVDAYQPSDGVTALLETIDLEPHFERALLALRVAPELREAASTAPSGPSEHRQAIGRALVAYTLVDAEDAGAPPCDGQIRDELVERVVDDLQGYGLGIGDFLARPFVGIGKRLATKKLVKDRGSITDSSSPAAGDILHFLARGDGVRSWVRKAIADVDGPVVLLGHSLGGIICVDLLVRDQIPDVAALITVGSQAPFLYEIEALPSMSYGDGLPDHFPKWLNLYDKRDILSYIGAGLFPGRVADVKVDNRQPFPQAHSAYWTNARVWQEIGAFVA